LTLHLPATEIQSDLIKITSEAIAQVAKTL